MKANGKIQRDRKFYLMLPVIAAPFLVLLFWILGGGSGSDAQEKELKASTLNTSLPDAGDTNIATDKLSYYQMADRDSAKMLELMRMDSNYRFSSMDSSRYFGPYPQQRFGGGNGAMAEQLYSNLDQLERQMRTGYNSTPSNWESYGQPAYQAPGPSGRPQLPYNTYDAGQTQGSDPEIDQLNTMLDKIMEIQNPELANERLRESSEKRRGEVFAVTMPERGKRVTLLDDSRGSSDNDGFYDLDQSGFSQVQQNAIRAVVHQDQVIISGSTVKMRLIDPVMVNGVNVPKDSFIFGVAQLSGERLVIKITSLRHGRLLFPIDLSVFDLDGIDGIYIPGSITRDAFKQSADRPLQSVNLGTLDGTWGGQAAGAGVEMVKGLFSKKAKLVKVKVKAGYQILLRDEKQKSSFGR